MRGKFASFPELPDGLAIVLTAAAYCLAAWLGDQLLVLELGMDNVVWPEPGLALAAMLLLGWRAWPGVLLGAWAHEAWQWHGQLTGIVWQGACFGMALGILAQTLAGAWLIRRHINRNNPLDSFSHCLAFFVIVVAMTLLGSLIYAAALFLTHLLPQRELVSRACLLWLSSASGTLLFGSMFLIFHQYGWPRQSLESWVEMLAYFGMVTLLTASIFIWWHPTVDTTYPLDMLVLPLVAWAAFRFTTREVILALLLIMWLALWGTRHGGGPYLGYSAYSTLIIMQTYIGILTIVALCVGALTTEQRRIKQELGEQQEQLEQQVRIRTLALEQSHAEVLALSRVDPVTGIANRRSFEESLDGEWRRARRLGTPLGMLMIDIDFFKLYNDHYGHVSGDYCLREVSQAIRSSVRRPQDLVARYGGEEIACLLPDTTEEGVACVAEAVLEAVRDLQLPHVGSSISSIVTISIGGATVSPREVLDSRQLIEAADRELYRAKQSGRNRIEIAGLGHAEPPSASSGENAPPAA
ncbi:MASE1 domain-containing protein [Chromobacterium sp. IIBBL 290-4]|uniref:sensor domain-containing diguanylate cyclase n=1 Tax=Chromobacterium sp. IIBBL 290-4 TaxID=2953890 RepID=UPI0020B84CD6|nr:MASE1 domain-containing protein [Chromobacterium sp. IIBBL 290-4]UTH75857.1 MASE1 domain-containing protein [Chromobacterium sp. IIBBL 290-4]